MRHDFGKWFAKQLKRTDLNFYVKHEDLDIKQEIKQEIKQAFDGYINFIYNVLIKKVPEDMIKRVIDQKVELAIYFSKEENNYCLIGYDNDVIDVKYDNNETYQSLYNILSQYFYKKGSECIIDDEKIITEPCELDKIVVRLDLSNKKLTFELTMPEDTYECFILSPALVVGPILYSIFKSGEYYLWPYGNIFDIEGIDLELF